MRRLTPFLAIALLLAACSDSPTGPGADGGVTFLTTQAAGTPGWLLDDSLEVHVVAVGGADAVGAWVHWSSTTDGAWFSDDSTRTGSDGIARVAYSPGWALGTQQVMATADHHSAMLDVAVTGMALEQVEVFDERVCGLDGDGRMWCWASYARDPHPNSLKDSRRPIPVDTPLRFTALGTNSYGDPIHPEAPTLCAISTEGEVWCAGIGDFSGPRYTTESVVPTLHRLDTPGPVLAISFGSAFGHSRCVIDVDHHAWCMGANSFGQLGDGTTDSTGTWQPVAGGLQFAALRMGSTGTCAITLEGVPYCWGIDRGGLESAGAVQVPLTVPTPVSGGLHLVALSTVGLGFCGLTTAELHALQCWGGIEGATLAGSAQPAAIENIPTTASSLSGDVGGGRVINGGRIYRFGYDGFGADYQYYGNNIVQHDITGAVRFLSPMSYYWCVEHEAGAVLCSYWDHRPVAVPMP